MSHNTIKIEHHIDVDHKVYALYDNHRNIAHIADGLKPSLRKIIYTAIETLKGNNQIKVSNLGNRASDMTHYSHGEDSINDAVVGLAQDFVGSNNFPLLLRQGQFGTKIDYENSDARYIHVKRHKNLDSVLDTNDSPILKEQFVDGDKIEPEFLLPKVPLILINGSGGVGNGYSSRILPRSLEDVKKAIVESLAGNAVELLPSFNGFTGRVSMKEKQIKIVGRYVKQGRTKLVITDLPPDSTFQYENYKNRVLLKLLDTKQIRGFEDESTEHEWKIIIDAPMEFCSLPQDKLEAKLGLTLSVTETLNCWGWEGKMMLFENIDGLLKEWIRGRLLWLETRRLSMIDVLEKDVQWLGLKSAFIQWWKDPRNKATELDKDTLKKTILTTFWINEEVTNRLLSLRITSLTMDECRESEVEMSKKMAEVNLLKTTKASDMLMTDINSVK